MTFSSRGSGRLGELGASRAGCLFVILVFIVAAYMGVEVIGAEIDYRTLASQVQRTARLAKETPDAGLEAQIRDKAAELGLPPGAGASTIRHLPDNRISISVQYRDSITFFGRWHWVIGRRIHVEQAS